VARRAHDRQRNISGGRKVPKKLSLLRLLAAGNFNDNIVRRLRRRARNTDIARVQDVGLSGGDNPTVLYGRVRNRRVLLSHDLSAFTAFAY
jgi:hypothetical protein